MDVTDTPTPTSMVVRSLDEAVKKCSDNGHKLVEVFDVRGVCGGHTPTAQFVESFKAQCQDCKALLRFYSGRFGGEAIQTTCAYAVRPRKREAAPSICDNYTLNDWRDEVHQCAISKGWWDMDTSRNFGDLIALIHTELSEAYEEYRDGRLPDERYYDNERCVTDPIGTRLPKPEGIPSELADVMIRLFDVCGYYGIDIQAALLEKHTYNLCRPYRHGGKVS